jgi:hypothetical protein
MLERQIVYYNSVFFFIYFTASWGNIACLRGKSTRLPFVSVAADRQFEGGMDGM